MQQLSRTILRNSAFGLAAQIAIKILSFAFTVLIIRNLGANDFGQYAAVIGFGTVFLFIADLGLAPYTVREVARLRDKPEGPEQIRALFADLLALRLILGLLSGIMVISAAVLTGRPTLMIGAIALNSLTVLIYAIHGSSEALLSGYERLDLTSGLRVVNQLVFVIVGAIALWLGFGYYGLIIATMIGVAVMTLLVVRAVLALGVRPSYITPSRWFPLLRAAFPFGVIGLTLGLSYRFDTVLLNIYSGDVPTGHYNAAYNLIFALVTLSNVLNTALYPSLSRQAVRDPSSLPLVYERLLRYLLIVALPIAVGGFLLAEPLVALLFGAEYGPTAPLLAILIWVLPLMFLTEFLGYVVVISGREARVARAVIMSSSVNIVANLLFIPIYGVWAAAIITVVTEFVLLVQYLWMLRDMLGQLRWGAMLRTLVALSAMTLLVWLVRDWPVLLSIALGGGLYGAILLLLRVVGPDEVAFVRALRGQ
ncbi:flippase [Candidatus Viridilinea mediisalina]|uniref:Polysaccharide biosynthesis protein n=1 Tax=Candidatus Viridilinea mediisalina TaxID=2024553 RepID=A0A2A6RMY1_9CHLR|nr:flippase [Candidatus Viridilinea mediisalina]PDW04397.1 polysaccharide biosynthesis protein [Candidatus Viridilinea mediisalina]